MKNSAIKNSQKILILLIAVMMLSIVIPTIPAIAGDLENRVKTAYIYNFTKFIEWPEERSSEEPIRICFVGSDPLRTVVGELKNRKVNGRAIKIVRLPDASSQVSCEMLFIGRSEERQLSQILERVQGTPVLTVSDLPQFSHKGGMIGFVMENERVKVEINPRAVRQSGLKVSAKLLEVARVTQ